MYCPNNPPLTCAEKPPELKAPKVPWLTLLRHRQTWAFLLAKALTDPVWWFYLYWLPKFLKAEHNVELGQVVWPLVTVYMIANVGSVAGGWLSGRLFSAGWSLNRSRKMAMLACALAVTPIVLAPHNRSLWPAVLLVGLAAAAHQGWSANLFTTASDMFPQNVVASVVGIGGFAGAVSSVAFQAFTGYFLEWTHKNYTPLFWVCALAYLVALALLHLLVPRLQPAQAAPQ
jgi:ACS family hexuronate transporter-like MFS transporter